MRRHVDERHVPLLQVVQAQHSADGETTKLLLQLQDGLTVESVIMHYDTTGSASCCKCCLNCHCYSLASVSAAVCSLLFQPDPDTPKQQFAAGVTDMGRGDSDADSCVTTGGSRATLCVSSEVGCQMGCTFCATGTMGLKVRPVVATGGRQTALVAIVQLATNRP
jgi:adenine C2-methylase RlmN of 23S rRNA A2503 and tRNA A37